MSRNKRSRQSVSRREFLKLAALASVPVFVAGCLPQGTPAPAAAPSKAAVPTAAPAAPAAAPAAAVPAAPAAAAPTAAATAVKAAAAAAKPLVVATSYGTEPDTLDPHYGESAIGMTVLNNVMETLVNYDRKMNLVPVLAESFQAMDDKVTWRFKLRKNVKFHNGEPFNADAVKFTVERTLNESLRAKGLNDPFPSRSGIKKITVVDPYTVDMELKEPNVVLPVFLTFLYMLEPKYYGSAPITETSIKPIGTGPFKITEWVKGDHITFQAFDGYWQGKSPLAEFRFKPIPEVSTRLNMLLAGEADIIGGITPENFAKIEADSKLRISKAPGTRRAHIGIPCNVERYKDRRVRLAICQAIDSASLGKALFGSIAPPPVNNVLVSGESWVNKDLPIVKFDPEAAKKALQEANFPFAEKVTVFGSGGGIVPELIKAVAGQLRKVGINAEAQLLDWTVFTDKMRSDKGIGDLYYLTLGSRANGPEDVSIVTTDQIWDQTQWSKNTENGPKFNALYKELAQTFDEKQQHTKVNELQKLFLEEHAWAHLWIEPVANGVNKRVTWEDSGGGNRLQFWIAGSESDKITG
jgi:peptide/nickel transport system substrate-binding protein